MTCIGLYLHIPFCLKKCDYCDFFSIRGDEKSYDEYVSCLLMNIDKNRELLSSRTIDTIYFGGGTPSCLGTDRIIRILNHITESYNVSDNAEITVEVNPVTSEMLEFATLKNHGVNRISIGMQSTDDDELIQLSRLHRHEHTVRTVDLLISGGISNFSLDIMLGIPLQTIRSLEDTLRFSVQSGASHLSTYMLKIEKNTPFYYNRSDLKFADDDMMADMYELTAQMLTSQGYRHYEISNFCRDDKISRHNMKYWRLDDYLGIGPSAHSMIEKNRFYYPRDFESFKNARTVYESDGKSKEEYIMLSLRTDIGLVFDEYRAMFNCDISPALIKKAVFFERSGFAKVTDSRITLSEKGFLLSNTIISELLS